MKPCDKNYLSVSLIYGSIEKSKYNYEWHNIKRYHNRTIGAYKAINSHILDMIQLRLEYIQPNWQYTCTPEEAQEVYDWVTNCGDMDFILMVKQVIHACDKYDMLDDRSLLDRVRNLL